MKAITLWQPWASLIAIGAKPIETRSWYAPQALVGQRLAIHAAARPVPASLIVELSATLKDHGLLLQHLPHGAIVATAILEWCNRVVALENDWATTTNGRVVPVDLFGDFTVGRYLWKLTEIQRIDPPPPARGGQRIWNYEAAC